MARRIGSSLSRSATLPTSTVSQPRPPARASTLPATATKPTTVTKPVATPPAATASKPTTNTPAATEPRPVKHAGAPEGAPSYSPWERTTGQGSDVAVSGGDNKLTAPAGAKQNVLIDKPGRPFQKDTFGGGRLSGNVGSMQASTTSHSGGGVHHYSAQAELQGPSAAFQMQKTHAGRFGVSSAQLTGEANSFKAQAQAGVSADTGSHAYTAALTAKAETGVGVTASASHDFNRHVGGYVKGEAKASATAFAEGVATVDPKTATAMVSGQVGAGATAGAYATAGGHVGRVHGSVTAGAVAGASAQAGGKFGLENGFLKHSADVNTALGVGTHVKTDVAVDLRHHVKPGIASGLRPALAGAMGVPAPTLAIEPEKSHVEKFFAKAFHRS
ncbi:hypothetical protein D7W79_04740 [Corallococcus exercitus]|uniref:hypothetical protein n=1 Tax=Corallococcus exercitus TaxID=2316736 RepID=UPI000EA015D9|nr:hypothetical protein [Corallococcus exercitus]RKG81689.1 hypothetical protein D7W79_04740 [Corallococcus exercitus]